MHVRVCMRMCVLVRVCTHVMDNTSAAYTQVLVVAGGIGVGQKMRSMVREAQAVQTQLTKVRLHKC